MIKSISINHFKSIKNLEIDFSKLNLFIGEPNTGKSNIIEAISIFSWLGHQRHNEFDDFIRLKDYGDLFFDHLTANVIDVRINVISKADKSESEINQGYKLLLNDSEYKIETTDGSAEYRLTTGGGRSRKNGINQYSKSVKHYKYIQNMEITNIPGKNLYPPYGKNLFSVVDSSKHLRKLVSDVLRGFDFKMVLRRLPEGGVILELQKEVEDYVIHLPYKILSDTIKNLIFHYLAIDSNQNCVLLFEEPEAHTFPFYTSELAEKISRDKTNQFFIVTHNQSFFNSIVLKTPKEDLSVFGVYLENGETKLKKLEADYLEELLELDPFLNLEKYI